VKGVAFLDKLRGCESPADCRSEWPCPLWLSEVVGAAGEEVRDWQAELGVDVEGDEAPMGPMTRAAESGEQGDRR